MKKAVIATGGKQYIVAEGDEISVELLDGTEKAVKFEPLLVIDGDHITVGTPYVAKSVVTADVVSQDVKADKVSSVRYKAKKRVHKVHGHRQHQTILKVVSIK